MGARSVLLQAFARITILLVWALVGWGVLLVLSALANALGEDGAKAFTRLLPTSGDSIWGWLGPLSVLLALLAALLGAAIAIVTRARRAPSSEP